MGRFFERYFFGVAMAALVSALVLVGCGKDDDNEGNNPDPGATASVACSNSEAWVISKSDAFGLAGSELLEGSEEFAFMIDAIDAIGISFRNGGVLVEAVQMTWTDALLDGYFELYSEGYCDGEDPDECEVPPPEVIEAAREMMKTMLTAGGVKWNQKGWYGVTAVGLTWSQKGDKLVITDEDGESEESSISVSGKTLTITPPPDEEGAPESITLTKTGNVNVIFLDDLLEALGGLGKSVQSVPGKLLKVKA